MAWWDDDARKLSDKVWSEHVKDVGDPFDEHGVKVSIAHTRQDVVLIFSLLSSLNKQVSGIKFWVMVIAVIQVIGAALRS